MKEYEYDFCMSLHSKIRSRIKPNVYIIVDDNNRLVITIYDKMYGITYDWILSDFSEKFSDGLLSDDIADKVIMAYRSWMLAKFFK